MVNALIPPFLDTDPKTAASKDKEEEEIVAMETTQQQGPSQLPNQDQEDLTKGRFAKVKILVWAKFNPESDSGHFIAP